DHAVVDSDRRTVTKCIIVGASRQANVVDDKVALVLRNDLADLILDRLKDLLGLLDASSRRRAHVQLNLAAIDYRKEVAADEHEKGAPQRQHDDRGQRHDAPSSEQRAEDFRVATAHGFEGALEPPMQACKPAERRLFA